MIRKNIGFWAAASAFSLMPSTGSAQAPSPAPPATSPMIDEGGYVRLEVVLVTTSKDKSITFESACPKKSLWGIELKELLAGAEHITLGVLIDGPGLDAIELTPIAIDKKRSGPLGLGKSCDVAIDQIRYLSPAYFVRSYREQQFTVAPTFQRKTTANPGLGATIDAAANLALKLSGVPIETATPYQNQFRDFLGSVSVDSKERFARHPVIAVGAAPADNAFEWRTTGIFKSSKDAAPSDLVLRARLLPLRSLISDPPKDAAGKPRWTVSAILTSPFAANLGVGSTGTLEGYVETVASGDLGNFRRATTKSEAGNACDPLRSRVRQMGLSDSDQALLMWAITRERRPVGIAAHDIDDLACLRDTWDFLPSELVATRAKKPETDASSTVPRPTSGTAPSVKQMKQTTQIDEAFAILFKTRLWKERRTLAASLFAYPAQYTDSEGALFDTSAKLDNVDQWLALHTAATPVADKIGCYTYVSASAPDTKSLMYAVADSVGEGKAAQVVVTATFAHVVAGEDPKIEALEVTSTVSADQKAAIQAANGTQCSSGYTPALIFGK